MTATQTSHTTATDNIDATSSDTSSVARILLCVFFFLAAWGGAIITWGLPGLYLPALALVPVCWALLLLISRG
jgi:hypothetical protein